MQFYHILDLETIVLPWGRVVSASEISETLQFLTQRSETKRVHFQINRTWMNLLLLTFVSPISWSKVILHTLTP